jgi:hypothetical protein
MPKSRKARGLGTVLDMQLDIGLHRDFDMSADAGMTNTETSMQPKIALVVFRWRIQEIGGEFENLPCSH